MQNKKKREHEKRKREIGTDGKIEINYQVGRIDNL